MNTDQLLGAEGRISKLALCELRLREFLRVSRWLSTYSEKPLVARLDQAKLVDEMRKIPSFRLLLEIPGSDFLLQE